MCAGQRSLYPHEQKKKCSSSEPLNRSKKRLCDDEENDVTYEQVLAMNDEASRPTLPPALLLYRSRTSSLAQKHDISVLQSTQARSQREDVQILLLESLSRDHFLISESYYRDLEKMLP